MKRLRRFLVVLIFLLLVACAFRSFAIYNDFRRHPDLYATYSAPWYSSIVLTVVVTLILIAIITVNYFIVGYINKKRNNKYDK